MGRVTSLLNCRRRLRILPTKDTWESLSLKSDSHCKAPFSCVLRILVAMCFWRASSPLISLGYRDGCSCRCRGPAVLPSEQLSARVPTVGATPPIFTRPSRSTIRLYLHFPAGPWGPARRLGRETGRIRKSLDLSMLSMLNSMRNGRDGNLTKFSFVYIIEQGHIENQTFREDWNMSGHRMWCFGHSAV